MCPHCMCVSACAVQAQDVGECVEQMQLSMIHGNLGLRVERDRRRKGHINSQVPVGWVLAVWSDASREFRRNRERERRGVNRQSYSVQ